MRISAFKAAKDLGILETVHEGTYCFIPGPSFESRAEARFLRSIGADCVGMSTVPEVVCAVHCSMKVLGLSLITNRVSSSKGISARGIVLGSIEGGDDGQLATHAEVLETSAKRSSVFIQWVMKVVRLLEENP